MIKVFIYAFALSLFCYGAWQLFLSFQYGAAPGNWKRVDGWLTEELEGFNLPGSKGEKLNALLDQPSVAYAYKVDGLLYYERKELPPCLAPVRAALNGEVSKGEAGGEDDFQFDSNEKIANLLGKHARFNPSTRKMEIQTSTGMIISTDYATNQLGAKWEELPEEQWSDYLYPIKIRYNPDNPHQSVTEPDLLKGAQTLLISGLIFMVIPILMVVALKVHENLTKPDELPDPFQPGGVRR
jgi:hypothetical protein